MEIEVNIPGLLRDCVGGRARLTIGGATLEDALGRLLAANPLLHHHLYQENGRLRQHVLIFYNGENIALLERRDVPLRPGDRIDIVQNVSGG
jgi:adenylyltransferase/sulfurtransferase